MVPMLLLTFFLNEEMKPLKAWVERRFHTDSLITARKLIVSPDFSIFLLSGHVQFPMQVA